ncbi:DUF6934 family protein [Flavobacterium beibuense]|uniref:Uncharacterized protein n=1 Tax=Flavobacterium beibuense TaxID=657326 RepID=A0A444WEN9_9FLAO|nr:hypothetical protein [Flavobacterium beibuense]RYJ44318.1 hypothetical protein NU09_0928 [Flavobacterium beibuense]
MIIIDLEDTIMPHYASEDMMNYRIMSPQKDGTQEELIVEIKDINDPLLPNAFNIGFGPPDGNGGFLHKVSLPHVNTNRVFSTVIVLAIAFLQQYPGTIIGIDGSDDRRAYLYHRMFRSNYQALSDILIITGVDWYVRLLRNGNVETDELGGPYFKPAGTI